MQEQITQRGKINCGCEINVTIHCVTREFKVTWEPCNAHYYALETLAELRRCVESPEIDRQRIMELLEKIDAAK